MTTSCASAIGYCREKAILQFRRHRELDIRARLRELEKVLRNEIVEAPHLVRAIQEIVKCRFDQSGSIAQAVISEQAIGRWPQIAPDDCGISLVTYRREAVPQRRRCFRAVCEPALRIDAGCQRAAESYPDLKWPSKRRRARLQSAISRCRCLCAGFRAIHPFMFSQRFQASRERHGSLYAFATEVIPS